MVLYQAGGVIYPEDYQVLADPVKRSVEIGLGSLLQLPISLLAKISVDPQWIT